MPAIRTPGPRSVRITNQAIARDAKRWTGQGYVYDAPNPQFPAAPGSWDCSSFVSWVLGHDLRIGLPGGSWSSYPRTEHGPVVTDYADWAGATDVGTPQAGDLCIWVGEGPNGHIGIAVSDTEMVSALNPTDGTAQTPIAGTGPAGAPLVYRRVNAVAILGLLPPAPPSGQRSPAVVVLLTLGLFAGALVLAAAGASVLAAGGVWAVRKAAA